MKNMILDFSYFNDSPLTQATEAPNLFLVADQSGKEFKKYFENNSRNS